MNTPNKAAALERLDMVIGSLRNFADVADRCVITEVVNSIPAMRVWDEELSEIRATLAQPDALTSQPSEVKRWQPSSFMEPGRSHVYARMQESDHGAFVLFDDYQKLLNSQPSGEAVGFVTSDGFPALHQRGVPPPGSSLYANPSADAPAVNSSLRVAALALADLAERNTDDLDLWQALIAAVRNASDAPGVAVDEAMVSRALAAAGCNPDLPENSFQSAFTRERLRAALTAALAPKPEGGHD